MADDDNMNAIDGVDVDLDLGDAFGGGDADAAVADGGADADALNRDVEDDLNIFDDDDADVADDKKGGEKKTARGQAPAAIDFSPPKAKTQEPAPAPAVAPPPQFTALAKVRLFFLQRYINFFPLTMPKKGKIPKKKKNADAADGEKKKEKKKSAEPAAEEKPKKSRKKKKSPPGDDDADKPQPQKRPRATRRKKYLDIKWNYEKGGYDVPHPKGGMAKMQEPKDVTITMAAEDGSGTQQMKLVTDEFVCIVWKRGQGKEPLNGGLWRIEKMVQDGVSKNALMRARRYVLAASVVAWPEGTKTRTDDGFEIIVATQCCFIVKTKYFADMVPITVIVDGQKKSGADGTDVSFCLDSSSYATEKSDSDSDGYVYRYVSPARDVPRDQPWTEFLKENHFTTPEPGTSFRHEPGYSAGQRTKILKPPPGSIEAEEEAEKPKKARATRAKKTKDSTAADGSDTEKKKPKREKKKKDSKPAPQQAEADGASANEKGAPAADAPAPAAAADVVPDADKKEHKKKEHKKKEHKKKEHKKKHERDGEEKKEEEGEASAVVAPRLPLLPGNADAAAAAPAGPKFDMNEPEKYMIDLLKTCVDDIPAGGSATAAQRNMILWAANGLMTFAPKHS